MEADMKTTDLSLTPAPNKLHLRDGTCFSRTLAGPYVGDPSPGQVSEIQGDLSDHARIGLVRAHNIGELPGFEIDYFLRET
jgi:hypothetical protein